MDEDFDGRMSFAADTDINSTRRTCRLDTWTEMDTSAGFESSNPQQVIMLCSVSGKHTTYYNLTQWSITIHAFCVTHQSSRRRFSASTSRETIWWASSTAWGIVHPNIKGLREQLFKLCVVDRWLCLNESFPRSRTNGLEQSGKPTTLRRRVRCFAL